MIKELEKIKRNFKRSLKNTSVLKELDRLEKNFLGPKGALRQIIKSLREVSPSQRKTIGEKANRLKKEIKEAILKKRKELTQERSQERSQRIPEPREKKIDITAPGKKIPKGHLHPLTQTLDKIKQIFESMGFTFFPSPEVETDFYNFTSLNMPPGHPARDLWDTFWLKEKEEGKFLLLRTHTTAMQLRYLETHNPPLRIISAGRCFRYEAVDSFHDIQFYQVDGLMIDKKVSIANFKAIIESFFKAYYGKEVKVRLRPGYFPFVEPGFEVDVLCLKCQGKGCSLCKNKGWIEMLGAGMVHPEVFKRAGLNPGYWQGIAFGLGIDRLAMRKYKISDIRLFFQNDIRFLKQF